MTGRPGSVRLGCRGTLDDIYLVLLQLAQLSAVDPEDEEGLPAAAHTMLLAVCTDATHGVLLASFEEGQQLQQSEALAGLTLEGPFGRALTHLWFCCASAVLSISGLHMSKQCCQLVQR